MTVVFFGTYNPSYPRNRHIAKIVHDAGIETVAIHRRGRGIGKYIAMAYQLARLRQYDVVFVGFPGHLSSIVARFVTRKPIYFDAFISLWDTYVDDRRAVASPSILARWYRLIDRLSCRLATKVIVDTPQHCDYFARSVHVSSEKIYSVIVSTDTDLFVPAPVNVPINPFIVFWHGKYTPLHGVEYIIDAARLMDDRSVAFQLLGGGMLRPHIEQKIKQYGLLNINLLPSVAYEQLPSHIQKANLCLGVFGSSEKVQRVVPNKIYEYLSCGKIVITRESLACREILNGADIRYVSGQDPQELVDLIKGFRHTRENLNSARNRELSLRLQSRMRRELLAVFNLR